MKRMFSFFFFVGTVLYLTAGCRPQPQPPGTGTQGGKAAEVQLSDANFQQQVLDASQPAMVDFFATWCEPCQQMAPTVEQLAADFRGRAMVGKVDVDRNPATANKYNIRGIPTFLFFKNGQLVEQAIGVTSKEDLARRLEALLKN